MTDKTSGTRLDPNIRYDGVAAEDLPEDSVVLKVTIVDLLPQTVTGSLGASIETGNVSLSDRDGNAISAPVTTANHIVATWDGHPFQKYPGLVKKGESVKVYQKAGQDKWYWIESGRGGAFRTVDRLHVAVSASSPSKPGADKDDTNTYTVGVDPSTKKMFMKSSKDNGEACAWSAEFDAEAGTFHISDDGASPGNRIFIDTGSVSGTPLIQINIQSGAALKLEGDNGFIKIPKMLQVSAGERVVIDTPLFILNQSQKGTIILNASTIALNAAASLIVSGATVGINAASTKVAGVLVAASGRINTLVKGAFGSSYNAASVSDASTGMVNTPSNSADTDTSGLPYKTS